MGKVVDARGLSCPHPVIMTKRALSEEDEVTVIVDDPVSRENVKRMGESLGCKVRVEERDDGIYLHIKKERAAGEGKASESKRPVLVVSSLSMGRGNSELGSLLIRAFFGALLDVSHLPEAIIFFNEGVKLTVEGSSVLDELTELEKKGVKILVCGTCLDFFAIKDKVRVGEVSNMFTIAETMLSAGSLVYL